jgi:hypothetical protein
LHQTGVIYDLTANTKPNKITFNMTISLKYASLRIVRSGLMVIAVFFLSVGYAFPQIGNPSGGLRSTNANDIWPRTLSGSIYNELWNYQFYFDDGTKAHIVFSVNNFGSFKSPVSGVRVTVHGFDGETWNLTREYSMDLLVLDKGTHTFRPRADRELYFTGKLPESHRVRINTTKSDVHYDIDLELRDIQQGFAWGNGLFSIGREQIGKITHIPYARVQGYISINGNRRQLSGSAYMDQTWQNQLTSRLVHSGYRFVYHGGPDSWDILYFMLPSDRDDRRTIGYRLNRSGSEVSLAGIKRIRDMTRSRAFGRQMAQNLTIETDNGKMININRSKDDEMYSILSDLPWIARRAARSFLGGEVYDLRGEAYFRVEGETPRLGQFNYFIID